MALDIEKCKECYYADEDGCCDKCCVDNAAFEPKRPNERVLEWISVKDRLPELIPSKGTRAYSETVLVWTSGRKMMCAVWDGIDFLCAMSFWEAWGEEITHWMPLPEPPKGE